MPHLTAQQLAAVHAVTDHDVHPHNGEILLTATTPGFPSLFLLDPDEGTPRPLLDGRGQYATWDPTGRRFVYLRDVGGNEAADLIWVNLVTGESRNLTRDAHAYTWPRFAPDGRLAALSNRDGPFDPYLLDPLTGAPTRLAIGETTAWGLAWSPEGRWVALARQAAAGAGGNLQFALHLLEPTGGEARTLAILGGDVFGAEPAWRPSEPPTLSIAADHGEYQQVALVDLAGEIRWLTEGEGEASAPAWSPDGERLAFLRERAGTRGLVVREADGRERALSIGPGTHHQPRWSPGGEALTVLFESATRPPDLWCVPLAGDPYPLTHSLPADFPTEALTPSTPIHFPTFDGQSIHGLLYTPREPNGAAVLWVHGGPTAAHRDQWFPDIQLLASLGYTVLAPNVRGSTGAGRTFRDCNRLDWGGGDLQDLAAAHDALQARGFHRVGIMGGSYGGYLTLMALAKQPERWDAGAALFPIADLVTLYESTRPSDLRPYLVDQIGTPAARPDFYRDRSPIHFVEQIAAPLLLLQGANDVRTPLAEAQSMAERLALAGKLHDFHVYPDEGHGFQQRATREDALARVIAFFNRYLR